MHLVLFDFSFPVSTPFLAFLLFCSILLWCCLSFFIFVLCTWFCLLSTLLSTSFFAFFLPFCFYLIWCRFCFLFCSLHFRDGVWMSPFLFCPPGKATPGINKPDRGSYRLKVLFLLGLDIEGTWDLGCWWEGFLSPLVSVCPP